MLQLYVNNTLADLDEQTIISVTKTYESVTNPVLYYSDFSKTVRLPISANNNRIFSNFNRLDSAVTNLTIDPSKKQTFVITDNREPVMEGWLRLDNANTIWTDECYEVTLYSTLGMIFNTLKMLTFNKNAEGVDEQYKIDSPLSDELKIDCELVKESFEQQRHSLNSDAVLDWIGFIPTYQGKYSEFQSDREQISPSTTIEISKERDEHYQGEYRSYYQQPFIWVDKLWKTAKDKISEITDYTLVLDRSWFSEVNPYWTDLIYTCPSLFTSDDNFKSINETFNDNRNQWTLYVPSKNPKLSSHRQINVNNIVPRSNTGIYDTETGIFNPEGDAGGTVFKGQFQLVLSTPLPSSLPDNSMYSKIRKDNPFYFRIKAVNANTNEDITGASKTFLLFSDEHNAGRHTYNEAIDLGITERNSPMPTAFVTQRPHLGSSGNHTYSDAYYWTTELNFALNVTENVPYRIVIEVWNANNGDPFESCGAGVFGSMPTWDWLWRDYFITSGSDRGYSMYLDINILACETQENLRTNSDVTMYRIFPKDTTLFDVILNYSKMFGLMWDVDDDNRTVTVMSRTRFFEDAAIEDWSGKIDRSKDFKFSPLTFDKRYVSFNYGEGQCGQLQKYESKYQYTYGSKKLDTGYEFNADENKLYDKLVPSVVAQKRQFSKMMNTNNPNRPNFVGYNYMVYPNEHYVDNDSEGSNAGMSGAFYFRNGTFTPDSKVSGQYYDGSYVVVVSDDTPLQTMTQEFCWNLTSENVVLCRHLPDISTISNYSLGKRWSVHFESPKEYFFTTPDSEIKYIYSCFWDNYINERYCSQNKKLTAYLYITPDEYKAVNFKGFVKIDNILYHIDKIYDYNFNSYDPVKMDLVQVWNLSAYTAGQWQFPYLYTDPERVNATTTAQTVTVYSSTDWNIDPTTIPSWLSVTKSNGNLVVTALSTTDFARRADIQLILGTYGIFSVRNQLGYTLRVTQDPAQQYRLNVSQNVLVFPDEGGRRSVEVDCHNKTNGAISVVSSANWVRAYIAEYTQDNYLRRDGTLHLCLNVRPNLSTTPRNASVSLSIVAGGQEYTQTVFVGQQGGNRHTRDYDRLVITDDEDMQVLDGNGNRVTTTLVSGTEYHFSDLFPEEIDINSIRITSGSVNITGNSGRQTVTFTPQLTDGATEGGGMITAVTMNGNTVSYNYNVSSVAPAPTSRRVSVGISGGDGMFRLSTGSPSFTPITASSYRGAFTDGTVITLEAQPAAGYSFSGWVDNSGTRYNTQTVTFTVGSDYADAQGNISYTLNLVEAETLYILHIRTGNSGYITVGSDTTRYTDYKKTVASGVTIADVRVFANSGYTFSQWSDGSTRQTRDFTMYSNQDLTVIYTGGSNQYRVTVDGGGLRGSGDTMTLTLDGNTVARCSTGETKVLTVDGGTYEMKLNCDIADTSSVFKEFYINNVPYTDNPYVDSNWNISADTVIKVLTAAPKVTRNITFDTTDLYSVNDTVTMSIDGQVVATGRYGQTQVVQVDEGTHTMVLSATLDSSSVFTSFKVNGTTYTTNPTRISNLTIDRNITVLAASEAAPVVVYRTLTVDGTGLYAAGDNMLITVDGTDVLTVGYGERKTTNIEEGTHTLKITCTTTGTFNSFTIGGTQVTSNPYTNSNWNLSADTSVTVSVSQPQPQPEESYFYIEDVSGQANKLSIKKINTSAPTIKVFKSTDGTNWSSMGSTSTTAITATIPANGKLYLKATANSWNSSDYNKYYNKISASGAHNVGGNITSLLYGDNFQNQTSFPSGSSYNFYYIFYNNIKLLSAASLALPATTLTNSCYRGMFKNCTSLTTTPALPAMTLAIYCYSEMFYGCTALTQAPALPATTLASYCYSNMFQNCTSLTTAPALPATTLADSCYFQMFDNCTSLTQAPELPATTMARCCYQTMFYNCTALTTTPDLPATTLADICYRSMFSGCTSLNKVITYATNISASNCLNNWLNGVSSTGDFFNLGGATYPSGESGIPTGWTEHTSL